MFVEREELVKEMIEAGLIEESMKPTLLKELEDWHNHPHAFLMMPVGIFVAGKVP